MEKPCKLRGMSNIALVGTTRSVKGRGECSDIVKLLLRPCCCHSDLVPPGSCKSLLASSQWLIANSHTIQRNNFVNMVTKHSWAEPILNSAQSV